MLSIEKHIFHKNIVFCKIFCYYLIMDDKELERRQIVAENIKNLIKAKGITQKELAKSIVLELC